MDDDDVIIVPMEFMETKHLIQAIDDYYVATYPMPNYPKAEREAIHAEQSTAKAWVGNVRNAIELECIKKGWVIEDGELKRTDPKQN